MALISWMDTLEKIRTRDFKRASRAEREQAARDVVNMCSYATALVSISPVPFSDALLTIPVQTGMVVTVGHIYGRKIDSSEARSLLMELGAAAGLSFLARQGVKAILPVLGALLTAPAAFAACWALGRASMHYFENPRASREDLEAVFERAKKEAKSVFSREAFEKFRKRNAASVEEAARQAGEKKEAPAAKRAPRKKKPAGAEKKRRRPSA